MTEGTKQMTVALALLMAIACSIGAAAETVPAPPADQAQATALPPPTYRLEAGDAIDIRFLSNPELNEQAQIRPDGRVSMQIVGELTFSGLTIAEATSLVTTAFKDTLKQPSVTVQVRTFANRRVFVAGEVAKPGVLPLIGDQTAIGAIAEAGGLRSTAKRNEIVVIRRGANDIPEQIRVSMSGGSDHVPQAAAFRLAPMDVVIVMESGIAKADRAVDQYVRQLIPVLLTGGFTYLFNGTVVAGVH
jgi:protein involved in polysaccharide export with SLBB domain